MLGIGAFLAWFAGALAELFATSALYWIALKAALLFLFVTVLPIVILNLLNTFLEGIIGIINSQVSSSGLSAQTLELTGLTAWLVTQFRIPEAFSIVLGAMAFKVVLKMIPFLAF